MGRYTDFNPIPSRHSSAKGKRKTQTEPDVPIRIPPSPA